MNNIKPFIDLGWHTVPLRGELKRLEDGSKTIPKFEEDWRVRYQTEVNNVASKLGGVITGEVSGIVAIDCDNTLTFSLFKALDPDYTFIFKSKGKLDEEGNEKVCGTFIYNYSSDSSDSFSINDGAMALDFYSNRGFVYLPTAANATKEPLVELPALKEIPAATVLLLEQLKKAKDAVARPTGPEVRNVMTAHCLAPLIRHFIATNGRIMPGLFRIITPKDFRDHEQYIANGYLHPQEVPEGRGSEYLVKVSAILGADISVDAEMYVQAMHYINGLFNSPMPKNRLDSTILDPMTEGKSSVDGNPIWQYDPDWESYKLMLATKRHTYLDICFDDRRNNYYVVDEANEDVKAFSRENELITYIAAAAILPPKKVDLLRSMPVINVESNPGKSFGFSSGADPTARYLNTFKQTPELAVLSSPDAWAHSYKYPKHILAYLESLVPDVETRTYLLRFIKRKLTLFEYSPVVLYFLGVHGSGKDLFVGLLEQIVGHVAKPTTKEFLEMFNGWLLDSYFVQLDEYGNQLTRASDRDEALGKIKAYTGKQKVQIRQMRTDGFMYHHHATFIMTANKNPLMMEDGDRRVALFQTPNKLQNQDWVIKMGGVQKLLEKFDEELKDFCYYLAKEVEMMSSTEYNSPPETAEKHRFIADSMYAGPRLVYGIKQSMKDYLVELAIDYNSPDAAAAFERGRINTLELEQLYMEMTDMNGDMRSLNKLLRNSGVECFASTVGGNKVYVYRLNWESEDADVAEIKPTELNI
ncbi:hypothetical protein [Dickeya phage Amaethon]|nr:hypothetical protein [Dickeya phage Amaethon]